MFEQEKPHLQDLPPYVEPPYRVHNRWTDRYGYVGVHGNFYWVPGSKREPLKAIEYAESIRVYRGQDLLIEHQKVAPDKKREKIKPDGIRPLSEFPQNRKLDSCDEERRLRTKGKEVALYVEWLKTPAGAVRCRHKFIRDLDALSRQLSEGVFIASIARALEYGIRDLQSIERIASQILHSGENDPMAAPWEQQPLPFDYQKRASYQTGCFTPEPEIENYGKLLEGKKDDQSDDDPESA